MLEVDLADEHLDSAANASDKSVARQVSATHSIFRFVTSRKERTIMTDHVNIDYVPIITSESSQGSNTSFLGKYGKFRRSSRLVLVVSVSHTAIWPLIHGRKIWLIGERTLDGHNTSEAAIPGS